MKSNRLQASDVLKDIRNNMFDSQYEIYSMIATEAQRVKDINQQRIKAASYQSKGFKEETLSEEFLEEMTQF
jgi:hypothetical protein